MPQVKASHIIGVVEAHFGDGGDKILAEIIVDALRDRKTKHVISDKLFHVAILHVGRWKAKEEIIQLSVDVKKFGINRRA